MRAAVMSTARRPGSGRRATAPSLSRTAGLGKGGQRLCVVPDLDLIVAFAAGAYSSEPIARTGFALSRQIVAAA